MATTTRTVRISVDVYNHAIDVMGKERDKISPTSMAVTGTETSWLSYVIEKGLIAIKHDRKEDRLK